MPGGGLIKWQWAPFAGLPGLTPAPPAFLKYAFLALAAAQFGIIKAVQKILPMRSADNLSQAAVYHLALCETVAVLGLVLFFAGRQTPWISIFL